MTKYNYKKASAIWDKLTGITFDMGDYFATDERQENRRYFLRGLTRGDVNVIADYINYITDFIDDFSGTKHLTDEDRATLEKLALQIVLFTNDNNY